VYLEKLQVHPNTHIYKKVVKLIETYFGTEDMTLLPPGESQSISIFDF
jgi:hypothetical protein